MHTDLKIIDFFLIWISLIGLSICQQAQNFTYSQSDQLIIKPMSNIGIYSSLTTVADEYLTSSSISLTNQIQQFGDDRTLYAPYNIYYFNLASSMGMECYQNWVLGNQIPIQSECPDITNLYGQYCHNYSGCYDDYITYSLVLDQWEYIQHMFYIHNIHQKNQLNLQTKMSTILISSNAWFFWAVGLTCLLMIMIVVLTGVVFNLNLKMKKTKKVYEQYKLTVENDINFVLDDDNDNKSD